MARHKRVDVSHKARRLVERAIRLHVEKATTYFYPDQNTTLAESNAARDRLARRAREAKEKLCEYIGKTEGYLEAHRELRKRTFQ